MAVARYILLDCSATTKAMSLEFSATIQAINEAIRKIREKLNDGLVIPGLSDIETENLNIALKNRDKSVRRAKAGKQEEKAIRDRVINIMREHVIVRMFEEGKRIACIARVVGSRKKDVRQVIEKSRGINNVVREMYQSGQSIPQIADILGLPREDVRKILVKWGYNLKVIRYLPVFEVKRRTISTIKPGKPKNRKAVVKRPAIIGRDGLADWCKVHYDKESGELKLPGGCVPPADLPRIYPVKKTIVFPAKEPVPSLIPAPPPPRSECSRRGRTRIGYMRFF